MSLRMKCLKPPLNSPLLGGLGGLLFLKGNFKMFQADTLAMTLFGAYHKEFITKLWQQGNKIPCGIPSTLKPYRS